MIHFDTFRHVFGSTKNRHAGVPPRHLEVRGARHMQNATGQRSDTFTPCVNMSTKNSDTFRARHCSKTSKFKGCRMSCVKDAAMAPFRSCQGCDRFMRTCPCQVQFLGCPEADCVFRNNNFNQKGWFGTKQKHKIPQIGPRSLRTE